MKPWSDALAYWLLDYYALATVFLAGAIAALGCLKQPAFRLLVARSSIVGLALLAVLAALPGWPRASWRIQNARRRTAPLTPLPTPAAPARDIEAAPAHRFADAEAIDVPSSRRIGPSAVSERSRPERVAQPAPRAALEKEGRAAGRALDWSDLAACLFLASGSTILVWLGVGRWRLRALRRRSSPAPQWSRDVLARTLGVGDGRRAPVLLISEFLDQPVTFGLLRPTIVLPHRFVEDEPRNRLEAALAHEWAHIRNRDLWWLALARLLLPALFVHPLYVWLRRRCRDDQELLADALAAHGRIDYAEALLAWSRSVPDRPRCTVAGSLALWERTSQLKRRILVLLDRDFQVAPRCPGRLGLCVRGATVCAVLGLSFLTFRPHAVVADPSEPPTAQQAATNTKTSAKQSDQAASGAPAPAGKPVAEARDVPINGRIVDLEGRPVSGVRLKVKYYRCPKSGNLDGWLAGVKAGSPQWVTANVIDWDKRIPETAKKEALTDRDGRFRLEGIGAERSVELELRGDTIAFNRIEVVTRKMPPLLAPGFGNQYGPGSQTVYGAEFIYAAAPCRPIEGVAKDAKTGVPLPDVEVRSTSFAGSNWVGTMALRVKTDAQGRFRLLGMPKGKNRLLVVPNDEQPYFLHEVDVPDPPGAGPVQIEVGLTRGLWIEGKLTEEGTGKPVAEARLFYAPFLDNTFAQAAPEFGKDRNVDGTEYQDRYLSKPDGSFRLVGLPGRALVGALAVNREYMVGSGYESIKGLDKNGYFQTYRNPVSWGRNNPTVMKEINPPNDAGVEHVELQVRSGDTVRYRVLDPDGEPASGTARIGLTSRGTYSRDHKDLSEGVVRNLYPGEERTVMFRDDKRKLGKVICVRKGDDTEGPVVVALEPLATITGRVLDADGNPVSGATIRPDLLPGGDFSPRLNDVSTGTDGRFTVPDVPAGCEYSLAVESGGSLPKRRFAFIKHLTIQPGATTNAGEIRFEND